MQAVHRTRERFQSLYETIKEEYWITHEHFRLYGCPLHPWDVGRRGYLTAWTCTIFIIFVTLPVALYHQRGDFFELWFLLGITRDFAIMWILFFILVVVAHFMYALSFIVGSKFGGSGMFLNYVGKRWGKRIEEIAAKFVSENTFTKMKQNTSEMSDVNGNKYDVDEEPMKAETDDFIIIEDAIYDEEDPAASTLN